MGLDEVDDPDRVVVAVPQVDAGLIRDLRQVLAGQRVKDISQRPDQSPQPEQLPLEAVEIRHFLPRGPGQDAIFHIFHPLPIPFQEREVMVGDGVQQRVGQKVGPGPAKGRLAFPNAVPNRVQAVASRMFLKRDYESIAQKHPQLFGLELILRLAHHVRHNELLMGILLHLGPLVQVDDILHRQRMEMKPLGDLGQHLRIAQAIDIQPDDPVLTGERRHAVEIGHRLFDPVVGPIRKHVECRGWRFGIDQQAARRLPRGPGPTSLPEPRSV